MTESTLRHDLAHLPSALRARLEASGFDAERLVTLAAPLFARARGEATLDRDERNRIRGLVEPPRPRDVVDAPLPGAAGYDALAAAGMNAMRRGELAFCVMAGGMATRMGGVVKALVEAFDGRTFLDLRLAENASWQKRAGRPVPLWLMTSEATDGPVRAALHAAGAPEHVATFTQDLGLRLTREGNLFRDGDGAPSTYAPGHGDLPDALRRSGLLSSFVARGGRYVWIANLDNLGAAIDDALLGHFIESGRDVLVEVAPKVDGDRGGIPVWADVEEAPAKAEAAPKNARRLQVLEEFRLPKDFDASAVRVFNTNTFLVEADALLTKRVRYSWFEVEKKVGDRTAVQFERLLQELTSGAGRRWRLRAGSTPGRLRPHVVLAGGRTSTAKLAKRREEIRAVARARGMLDAR